MSDLGEEVDFISANDDQESNKEEKEKLFLIEFLVDTLKINNENLEVGEIDPCLLQGQVCLTFKFLHFPKLSVCEQDVDPTKQTGNDEVAFNCGKSLMFALTDSQAKQPPSMILNMTAHRTMPHGFDPPKLDIGETKICMTDLFSYVTKKVQASPSTVPFSKSIKKKYELLGGSGKKKTAECGIFIRLTCMGQNIVTEFQREGATDDGCLFKSKESDKVFVCKPKSAADESSKLCPPMPGWGSNIIESDQLTSQESYDENEYEEFSTEINGHCLTVRVQKQDRPKKGEKINPEDFCDCDFPLPEYLPDYMPNLPNKSKQRQPSNSSTKLANGNQIVFKIPPNQNFCKKGDHNAVVYNVSTCDDGKKHGHSDRNNLKIVSDAETGAAGEGKTQTDADKDSFVLRIGKKGKYEESQGKLELELRTPKTKVEEPPKLPYMVDREVQTDSAKKGKKGKKGKE